MSSVASRQRPHPSGQTKACAHCGQPFARRVSCSARDWESRRFCSRQCVDLGRAGPGQRSRPHTARPAQGVLAVDLAWKADAACRGSSFDFVPDRVVDARRPLAVCRWCPVRAECLGYGLATHAYGVWGGAYLTPETRARLRAANSSTT